MLDALPFPPFHCDFGVDCPILVGAHEAPLERNFHVAVFRVKEGA